MGTKMDPKTRNLTPREIVAELDKYIVGQNPAKRAVAIALRNRWRRRQVPESLRDEIMPKNIIMIGPTGVGKTEVARRLARLAAAPFIKVEASKFTEVGYVGRDVESMVRDLVEVAVKLAEDEEREQVRTRAGEAVEERLLDLLLPPPSRPGSSPQPMEWMQQPPQPPPDSTALQAQEAYQSSRERFRQMLRDGSMEMKQVEVEVATRSGGVMQIFSGAGLEEMAINLQDALGNMMGGKKTRRKKVRVREAREVLQAEEEEKLIDREKVVRGVDAGAGGRDYFCGRDRQDRGAAPGRGPGR